MRGNVKVMLPDVSDEEYNAMEAEVINKFIELGDEDTASAISVAEDTLMNTIKFEKVQNGIR